MTQTVLLDMMTIGSPMDTEFHVELLVHPTQRKFAVRAADKQNKNAVVWAKMKDGRKRPRPIACAAYSDTIYSLFGWKREHKYRMYSTLISNGDAHLESCSEKHMLIRDLVYSYRCRAKQVKCEFTGMIHCPHCGANYRHITSNGSTGWRCQTYQEKGAVFCHSKKIPDDTLRQCSATAMGMTTYSADAFVQLVDHIEVPEDNLLEFFFRDGQVVRQRWADRSRRDSWTAEMREQARQHAMRRGKA